MVRFSSHAASVFLIASFFRGCASVQLPPVRVVREPEPEALSWPRAVELALARNPDILQARAEVESRRRSRNSAFGDYLPTADGSFGRSRTKPTGTDTWEDGLTLDLAVDQRLFTGFKTTGDYLRAKREWEAARFAYQGTSATVRFRLRSAFVGLLRLRKRLEVNERIAERRWQNAELTRLRYEAGRENRGSMLRAQANAEEADFDVRQARRQIESEGWRLSQELGGVFVLSLQVEGELERMVPEPQKTAPDYPALAEATPEVQRAIKIAGASKAAVLSVQSQVWPKVDGSFGYGHSGSHASDLDERSSLGLRVTMPFFRGGKNIQDIKRARADLEAAKESARSVRDARIADLAAGWTALEDAVEFVRVRKAFLEASRERADIVRNQYATGLASFTDFDVAEQEFANSDRSYVNSLADALEQEARWESLKGTTLEDAIHAE